MHFFSEYGGPDYWIDGMKSTGPTNSWYFSDNSPMPLWSGFWSTGAFTETTEYCVRLKRNDKFVLNDIPCGWTYAYICEY